jgi:DNA-binding SARP family transcriptional activator
LINPELTSKSLVPFHAVWWLLAEAHHWRFQGESERVEDTLARLHDVANRAGLMVPESASTILELWGAGDGDVSPSEERLAARLVASTKSGRRQETILSHLVTAEWRLRRRESSVALALARTAVDLAERTGQVVQRLTGLIIMAVAEGELDLQTDAQGHLHEAYSIIPGEGAHKLRFQLLLVEAFLRLRVPDSQGAARLLHEALALARERGYVDAFVWLPWKMSELLSFALTAGIEVEYATRLIRRRRLVAGENSPVSWPWPVRILTLGNFSILIDGVPLAFSGKSPRRPLELLKGLIARGGRGVDAQNLWESLWPEAEGDAAAGSFAMALHRLRKLLKEDGALTLDEGKLSLNSRLCQVDAWLFESLCDQSIREDIRTTLQANLERALSLYRGQFLDDETVHAWMLPARDRFRSKMLTAVKTLAGIHAQDSRWDQVRQVYERALEVDHFYEPLYQGLMESLLESGERGAAMDVYRRCRDMLAMTFGAMPSERTELLRQGASRTAIS